MRNDSSADVARQTGIQLLRRNLSSERVKKKGRGNKLIRQFLLRQHRQKKMDSISNSCVSIVLFPLLSLFDETPAKREEQERDCWHLNVGAGGQVMAVCHRLTFL